MELERDNIEIGKELTPQQELFILYYMGIGQPTFGNATRAYMKAFDYPVPANKKRYNVASVMSSRLLGKDKISKACADRLKSYAVNEIVDQERQYVITQRTNVVAKVMAIKTYDELKGRITRKLKLSGTVKPELSEEQLATMLGVAKKKLSGKK